MYDDRMSMRPVIKPLRPPRDVRDCTSQLENPLAAERAADAVVECAEARAREVALIVARVEMIRDVEHLEADRRAVAEDDEPLRDLSVERHEARIPADRVSRTDEVAIGVDVRQRET